MFESSHDDKMGSNHIYLTTSVDLCEKGEDNMSFIVKIQMNWHRLWLKFNEQLYLDCLDDKERKKISKKIDYHKSKMKANG